VQSNPQNKFWWQVVFEDRHFPPGLSDRLCRAGSTGVTEEADRWTAYFDPDQFPDEQSLRDVIQPLGNVPYQISRLPAEDWGEEWRKHFTPIRVSKRFIVRPSWETYSRRVHDKVIIIDPKMAFGTGTHETTQLVLEIIDERMMACARVLDVGTGSGILAIAAAKLNARKVVAVDVETESMDNAAENIRRNRVSKCVRLLHGSVADLTTADRRPYDWILANIQRSAICGMLGDFCKLLKKRGVLVVSGILMEEDRAMQSAFSDHRLRVVEVRTKGEWMAYRLEKAE